VREARQIPGDTNPEASAGPQSRSFRVVAWNDTNMVEASALGAASSIPLTGNALHDT